MGRRGGNQRGKRNHGGRFNSYRGGHRKRQSESNVDSEYTKKSKRFHEPTPASTSSTTEAENFEASSSEEEEEAEKDPFKQLLSTFASASEQSRLMATVSDEEEDDEVDDAGSSVGERESSVENEGSASDEQDTVNSGAEEDTRTSNKEQEKKDEDLPEIDSTPLEEEDSEDDTETDDIEGSEDPFTKHLQWELSPDLLEILSAEEPLKVSQTLNWPKLGNLIVWIPTPLSSTEIKNQQKITKISLAENVMYAPSGSVPKRIQSVDWDKLYVKQQIRDNIQPSNVGNLSGENTGPLTPLQCELFSIFNNYQDFYFPNRTHQNGEEIRFSYCLHSVNHVMKTRLKILHHNTRLNKKTEVPDEFRDQGLVRPKVLILLPFKDAALRTVNMLASILLGSTKGTIMNYKRFTEEFGGSELALPKKNPRPEDYEKIFTGNTDDTFRIGLTVTKKRMKLYSDFYHSDIIIASPLGLRVIIGAEGEEGRDYDFLASLEVLILDQADIFLQQNWDHLMHAWDHIHRQPRDTHDADFSRLRPWALAGHARYYRQTLLMSAVPLPEFSGLINRKCHNYAGVVRVANPVTSASICQVVVHLPQVFHRLEATTPAEALDARFEIFTNKILPQYRETLMSHTLIVVSSYFDYVRIRNYFKKEDIGFVQICEYSKEGKIARARDMFYHNDTHFLLYSERFHFFRRLRVKGIRHLIFYQPPIYPHFYSEMCNLMQEVNQNPREGGGTETNMSVTVLYSKYDAQRLVGIVGTERASRMLSSNRKVHMMVTGGE